MVFDVLIITGSDKWLVNLVEKELFQLGLSTHVIRVAETKPETVKKLKLAVIFGIPFSFKLLFESKKPELFPVTVCQKEQLNELISEKFVGCYFVILMNFPEKMPVLELPIHNFHPSMLPAFPGLMSIPKIALNKLNGGEAKFGATVHLINENFDAGEIVWQRELEDQSALQSMQNVYENCYKLSALAIKEIIEKRVSGRMVTDIDMKKSCPEPMSSMRWPEVLNLILMARRLILKKWLGFG